MGTEVTQSQGTGAFPERKTKKTGRTIPAGMDGPAGGGGAVRRGSL